MQTCLSLPLDVATSPQVSCYSQYWSKAATRVEGDTVDLWTVGGPKLQPSVAKTEGFSTWAFKTQTTAQLYHWWNWPFPSKCLPSEWLISHEDTIPS